VACNLKLSLCLSLSLSLCLSLSLSLSLSLTPSWLLILSRKDWTQRGCYGSLGRPSESRWVKAFHLPQPHCNTFKPKGRPSSSATIKSWNDLLALRVSDSSRCVRTSSPLSTTGRFSGNSWSSTMPPASWRCSSGSCPTRCWPWSTSTHLLPSTVRPWSILLTHGGFKAFICCIKHFCACVRVCFSLKELPTKKQQLQALNLLVLLLPEANRDTLKVYIHVQLNK